METNDGKESISQEETNGPVRKMPEDNYEINISYRILTDIMRQNKATCWPFTEKVDSKGLGLWDYEIKIKEPMWLNKMLEKFDKNEYSSITEFAKDFRTMVENCYRYNGTDHAISKKAKRLEMIFEGKIALLKKDVKEKASLHVTSQGKFAVDKVDDSANNSGLMRSGRGGGARDPILDDYRDKLVYDFVKCEEVMCQEDERKSNHRERRQQEILYQQIAASWIATLESSEEAKQIKTCEALPEIGFFMHLTESVLKFPELNMYALERCFLHPEQSLYLAKIMTCLLCTYQERSQVPQRPPMHFSTWNKRLKERVTKWFETVQKYRSYSYASEKIGINLKLFEVLNWKNPFLDNVSYNDLDFVQRVHLLKALCDTMFLLQSIQSAMLSMDSNQLQCMILGKDCFGNIYIYFPQFCGDDVRIYRHRDYGQPVANEAPEVEIPEPKREPLVDVELTSVKTETPSDEIVRNVIDSMLDRVCSECNSTIDCAKKDIEAADNQNENMHNLGSDIPKSSEDTKNCYLNTTTLHSAKSALSSDRDSGGELKKEHNDLCTPSNSAIEDVKKEVLDSETITEITEKISDAAKSNAHPQRAKSARTPKRNCKYDHCDVNRPQRSLRKRNANLNYNKLTTSEPKENKKPPVTKRKNRNSKAQEKKQAKKIEQVELYGNIEFEMLCDSVESIQSLLSQLQVQSDTDAKQMNTSSKQQLKQLISKLQWLYSELEPWSSKLQKAKQSAQIQMKREFDKMKMLPRRQESDPWSEELNNKNTYVHGDHVTISHGVYSPASSIASYNEASSDEDYVHPYSTRKSTQAISNVQVEVEEPSYIEENKHLRESALWEFEYILQENIASLVRVTDRAELNEASSFQDGRCTRGKRKKQSKALRKVLRFAEERTTVRPSLLPVLPPDSDVHEIVDSLLLQEEVKQKQLAEERRLKRAGKRKLPVSKLATVNNCKVSRSMTKREAKDEVKVKCANIAIRMQNGRVYPAARLSDGSIVPIARMPGSDQASSSVQELINKTHIEIKKKAAQVPHINLSPDKSLKTQNVTTVTKAVNISASSGSLENGHVMCSQATPNSFPQFNSVSDPQKPIYRTVNPSLQAPKNAVVAVANSSTLVQRPVVPTIQVVQRAYQIPRQLVSGGQNSPIVVPSLPVNTVVNPGAVSGPRFDIINVVQPSVFAKSTGAISSAQPTQLILSPSPHVVVNPILSPVQIVTNQAKYRAPTPTANNIPNKSFMLVQNSPSSGLRQVRIVTPVMNLVTPKPQPQQKLQVVHKVEK